MITRIISEWAIYREMAWNEQISIAILAITVIVMLWGALANAGRDGPMGWGP